MAQLIIETTFCKECGNVYDKSLKECPHCGAASEKPPSMKKIYFWVIIAVLLSVVAAGIAIGSNYTPSASLQNQSASGSLSIPNDPGEITVTPNESPTVPTNGEEDYLAMVTTNSQTLHEEFNNLAELTSNPTGDDVWYYDMYAQISTINDLLDQAYDIQPPEGELSEAHDFYMNAIACWQDSMDYLEYGITNNDAEAVKKARESAQAADQYIDQANEILSQYLSGL